MSAALFFLFAANGASAQGSYVDDLEDANVIVREAADRARKMGFGDLEIDNLHGSISAQMQRLMKIGGIPPVVGDDQNVYNRQFYDRSETSALGEGKDSDGKAFLRLRIREGTSSTNEVFPQHFLYRAHCYLYPSADGASIDKIIFQFYKINFSGTRYVRELRRFVHPNPRDVAQAEGKPIGADLSLLNNNQLLLEYFEEAGFYDDLDDKNPAWEYADRVPKPVLTLNPRQRFILNDDKDPIPYGKQVKIINQYKKLLRRIDANLRTLIRTRLLDRNIIINRVMEF